jgi:hypothetical protein
MIRIRPAARGAVLAILCAGALVVDAAAQSRTTSAVRGTVTQADGSPVVGATVRLRQTRTGNERVVGTDPDGRFLISLLQPGGPYTLSVSSLGFAQETRQEIQLQVGEMVTVNLTLRSQAIEVQGIEVTADRAEIFNPGQVGPATLLNERTVESLPILSRNLMELAVLSPLVKTTEQGGFSVAGQNDRYNSILIDGVASKDVFGLTAGGVPGGQAGAKLIPLDAVSQYEILVAPFDVRLSGFTGGVMNAVTKTGTNTWSLRGFGVHRTEALIGDLNLPTGPVEASGVDRSLFGLSVGGPIIRDRAHFFASGEFERRKQPPDGYNLLRDDPDLVRVGPDRLAEFTDLFEERYGLETGEPGPYPLGRELSNIFARVDWTLGGGHRVTVRNLFAKARNDESPNRAAFDPYGLSSNAVLREGSNNTSSVQVFSDLGRRGANEFNLTVQRTTDASTPVSDWPQVEIDLISTIDGVGFERGVRLGSEFFAQENDLTQTNVRLTNSLSLQKQGTGSTYTLGVTGAYYDISHRYLPGARGDWFFASLQDFVDDAPQRYQRTVLTEGQDPTVDFSVVEWGTFVQNEIAAGKGLTMRFGLRLDVPHVLDSPAENVEVTQLFGHSTGTVPSGGLLLSPRWGFNWQSEGRLTTQVRGGAGMFVGQPPFVWLANAFQNDGLRSLTQICTGRRTDDPPSGNTVPRFDPFNPPTSCLRGDFQEVRTVTLFDEDFKYPQDLKFSAVVDQELSPRISMSLGVLFNKAINQIVLEELNLGDPLNLGPTEGYGEFDRRYFGQASDNGFAPTWDHPEFGHVLLAKNESEDWGASITAELRGSLTERLAFQTGYSLAKSYDKMSLVSTDMISNFGLNAVERHPNAPGLTTSNFDRPHKIVAAIYGEPFPGIEGMEISVLYTGQSGLPFTYVYRGDLNGDGYPGAGPAFDRFNDPIYVPERAGELPSSFATQALLSQALESDECLAKHRGRILPRNACRAPWQNRLDLRLTQRLEIGTADVRFEADLINVLNLINPDWGTVQSIRPIVTLIEPVARRECRTCVGELVSQWAAGILPIRTDEGGLRPTDPWSVVSPDSQWQAQFGMRLSFGGARFLR